MGSGDWTYWVCAKAGRTILASIGPVMVRDRERVREEERREKSKGECVCVCSCEGSVRVKVIYHQEWESKKMRGLLLLLKIVGECCWWSMLSSTTSTHHLISSPARMLWHQQLHQHHQTASTWQIRADRGGERGWKDAAPSAPSSSKDCSLIDRPIGIDYCKLTHHPTLSSLSLLLSSVRFAGTAAGVDKWSLEELLVRWRM